MLQYFMQKDDFELIIDKDATIAKKIYGFFVVVTGAIGLCLWLPSIAVLREMDNGPGPLIPMLLTCCIWIYGAIRGYRPLKQRRVITAYGVLLGSTALSIVTLLYWLERAREIY